MDVIEEFVDERQKSWCLHCSGWIAALAANRDHVPSKSLLRKPYPANLPVIPVCKSCNTGFSLDEEYFSALLGAALSGTTEPERQPLPSAARILERNPKLRARIDRARTEYRTRAGECRVIWAPEHDRINSIVVKNARGHAFLEYGEPMLEAPAHAWSAPLESMTAMERATFEDIDTGPGWPEVGSRMMTRVLTGQDLSNGWVIVQEGVYRYAVAQQGTLLVRTVLHEYLATETLWAAD
jgi:hypothetical protein